MVGKLAFVPAGTLNPLAGFGGSDFFADEFDGFGNGLDVTELDGVEVVGGVEVAMGVDESGSGGAALEVDDASVFGSEVADFFVRANGDYFAAADCDGLSDGIVSINRDDFSVDENEVRGI